MRKETVVHANGVRGFFRGIRGSLVGAAVLLVCDVVLGGGMFYLSMLVGPFWVLGSLLKSAYERPGWGVTLGRIVLPPLILWLGLANNSFQLQVAESRAKRVIAACLSYHAANGRFPSKLDELVPQYMPYIPSARYCPGPWSRFQYHNSDKPSLFWYTLPPYGRKIYNFDTRSWSYLD